MDELLEQGYLAPLVIDTETPETIDTSNVKVAGGDYVIKDLEGAVIDPAIIKSTVDDMFKRGTERKKWLVFCVTIAHAQAVLDEINHRGKIKASIVTSKTPARIRDATLLDYKAPTGSHPDVIDCLVNVACLTTGFDAPETDLIALLRPTKSPVLYVQIAGRGMRIADGKKDCLWLDYTSTTRDLGPVNLIKGRNKQNSTTEQGAPFKYCPDCGNPNPIHLDECHECGALMPSDSKDPHGFKAGQAMPLHVFQTPPEEWFDIQQIGYYKHPGKNGKAPTMRIDYFYSELEEPISEWKCFEHEGFALRMGCQWWTDHMPHANVPFTVDEALEVIHDPSQGVIALPTRIMCQRNGKFMQVKKYQYGNTPNMPKVISYKPSSAGNLIPF